MPCFIKPTKEEEGDSSEVSTHFARPFKLRQVFDERALAKYRAEVREYIFIMVIDFD